MNTVVTMMSYRWVLRSSDACSTCSFSVSTRIGGDIYFRRHSLACSWCQLFEIRNQRILKAHPTLCVLNTTSYQRLQRQSWSEKRILSESIRSWKIYRAYFLSRSLHITSCWMHLHILCELISEFVLNPERLHVANGCILCLRFGVTCRNEWVCSLVMQV